MKIPVPTWVIVVAASLGAGVAMSWGQTYAPDAIAPMFNSAAPVVALAAGMASLASSLRTSVLWGAAAGPLAMAGYYGMSAVRGFGVNSSFVLLWCVAGVLFGSVMGIAVWVINTRHDAWAGAAAGFWPGVALGEAAHGRLRIAESTPVAYWLALAVLGAVVLYILLTFKTRGALARVAGLAATAVVAGAVYVVYGIV